MSYHLNNNNNNNNNNNKGKDNMKEGFLAVIAVIVLIGGVPAMDYSSFLWESFMAPKKEEMRRNVFENTRSFREGKKMELLKAFNQYNTQPDNRKEIAAFVRISFVDVNPDELEPVLRDFLDKCYTGNHSK